VLADFSNLEWTRGYEPCFGVTLVDHDFERMPKDSAWALKRWFENAVASERSRL
jgi:beta-glucosidase/6-phospho-beta-glucosidase/beta-galactosidase